MSLCGGLKDIEATEMSSEKFMQFTVTYDEFCQNPSILTNPNLVIRLADKYYNWQIAGPLIMSALVFQQPLSEVRTQLDTYSVFAYKIEKTFRADKFPLLIAHGVIVPIIYSKYLLVNKLIYCVYSLRLLSNNW